MNNRGNNDYDELEPRVTPQPTVLKCISAPSVPEVSMIFGKRLEPTDYPKARSTPDEQYETYASWKKDEFPPSLSPNVDSRYAIQFLNKSSTNNPPLSLNSPSKGPTNFAANPSTKFRETPSKNDSQSQTNQSNNLAIQVQSFESPSRISTADNVRFHNNHHRSNETLSAFPLLRTNSESPIHKKSYEGVKSILKSSQFERAESANPSASPDCRYQRKIPSQNAQTPRSLVISDYPRSPSLPQSNRQQIDAKYDHGTVRDLLLLVKNQNEQIKSLQSQVERLLKVHEESIAVRNVSKKSYEAPQSPGRHSHEENITGGNGIASQKSCHSRGMKIPSSYQSDEPDVCLRYQNDQMRGAIMEQKVSIGVMTSFEFSVHNNPFVTDSSVIRDCGKNLPDSQENWRANVCSRNVAQAALENINEDSESHPSSLWRNGNSSTQMSGERAKRNSPANEKINYKKDSHRFPPLLDDIGAQFSGNDSSNFFQKSSQPPVPAPRRISTCGRRQKVIPANVERRLENFENLGYHADDNLGKRESEDLYRAKERNNFNGTTSDDGSDRYLERYECSPKKLDKSNREAKSIARENTEEVSLVLSGSELKLTERAPSPDPSIHVEMREYSSDDEEQEKPKCAPPVGWTFYKNIVGQVNRILHTIPDAKDTRDDEKDDATEIQREVDEREEVVDSVKLATLERLKMLGISFAEHSEYTGEHVQKKVTFDSSYCPRLDYQTTLPQPASTVAESNTSMHMKALALKYLSDEQLADLAVQKQGDGSGMKHKILNSVHGTNMSLATMNYLQRYCLVSGVNTPHAEGKGHMNTLRQKKLKHVMMTQELHAQAMPRQPAFNDSASKKEPDNILDITTLKQQPKLL